jgi:hypothetical protein
MVEFKKSRTLLEIVEGKNQQPVKIFDQSPAFRRITSLSQTDAKQLVSSEMTQKLGVQGKTYIQSTPPKNPQNGDIWIYIEEEEQQAYAIRSDGTNYIDTGVIPYDNLRVDIYGRYTKYVVNSGFGAKDYQGDTRFYLRTPDSTTYQFGCGDKAPKGGVFSTDLTLFSLRACDGLYINGVKVIDVSTATWKGDTDSFQLMRSLKVNPCYFELHWCKIWKGEILIRDFIPQADGTLLDKVNNITYKHLGSNPFEVIEI